MGCNSCSGGVKRTGLINAARVLTTGKGKAESTKQTKRIEVCNSCEHLLVTRQCGRCLCFVDLKTKVDSESCPINKW